ncbi:MAG: polysaccharide biosynthesis protein [Nitrospinaceae bacterium]
MGNFLVIGGTGVMGQAAIQAVRETFGDEAVIVANWYGKEIPGFKIEHVNQTIFGDITDPECIEKIKSSFSGKIDFMFYATALGDVGLPIQDATPEQIANSNRLSFDPILVLEQALDIQTIVAYSTFYVIRHQLCTYGAMGYSKEAIEKWAVEPGKSNHACIRAGLFQSPSSRGIKLLLRKMAKRPENLKDPLLRSYFENVPSSEGIKRFEEGIFKEEKETYGDSRTTQEDLYRAHLELFRTEHPIFVNVCGKKIWHTDQPLLLKDYL